MSDPIGTVIERRYEIVEVIGRGGQGIVCRAHDRTERRDVAVKMLTDAASQDPQFVERLRREQQAMAVLKGTSAVQLIDLCNAPSGALCLVMELLDGTDFEARLIELETRNEHLASDRLLAIIEPLVETLEQAHAAGIVHRDIKPANIFLLSDAAGGGVRLLDFGFARLRSAQPLTAQGMVLGSPSYIAPEVWKGLPNTIDHRVDVYALGVIVFRALTGKLPFGGESLYEKFMAATTAERPKLTALRPDLPPEADAWLAQALAIDRADRFSDVRAFHAGLAAALGHSTREKVASKPAWGGLGALLRAATDVVKRITSPEPPKPVPAANAAPEQAPTIVAEPEPIAPVPAIMPARTIADVHAALGSESSAKSPQRLEKAREDEQWPFAPPPRLSEWQARISGEKPGAGAQPQPAKRQVGSDEDDPDPSDTAKTLLWIDPKGNKGRRKT